MPSAPEGLQRTPETLPQPATPPAITSEPPAQPTLQRTPAVMPTPPITPVAPSSPQPLISPAAIFPRALEQIQRTPDAHVESAPAMMWDAPETDVAPFRPINRYRDPRVLSRSIDTSQSLILADLPLTRSEPTALLPQARPAPTLPLATPGIQRSFDQRLAQSESPDIDLRQFVYPVSNLNEFVHRKESQAPSTRIQAAKGEARTVQRSQDEKAEPQKSTSRRAVRVPLSSPRTSTQTRTVQRSPLPLAKLRTKTNNGHIQRDKQPQHDEQDVEGQQQIQVEEYIGPTESQSGNNSTAPEDLQSEAMLQMGQWGNDLPDVATTGSCTDSKSRTGDKDLDRLAIAILPLIKRMLAVERDRRNPRPLL